MLVPRKPSDVMQPLLLATGALVTSIFAIACSSEPFSAAGGGGSVGGAGGHGGEMSSSSVVAVSATSATTTATSSTGVLTSSCLVQVVDWYDVGIADVMVVVHDAIGEPVYTTQTDSAGQAHLDFPADGSVSVYASSYDPYESHGVNTYMTPPDGSVIRVRGPGGTAPPIGIPTTYKVVAQGFPAGTTNFTFQGHCDSQNSNDSYTTLTNAKCTDLPTEEFLVTAKDQNGKVLAWGQASAFTSPGTTLDLVVFVSNTNFHTVTGTLTNLPASTEYASLYIDAVVQPHDSFYKTVMGVFPSFSMTGDVAALPIDRIVTLLARPENAALYETYFSSSERYGMPPNTFAASLNDIANITASSIDTSDPTRPTITWSTDGGPSPDRGLISLYWTLGTVYFNWVAVFPGTHPTTVTFPRPSLEAQGYAPSNLVTMSSTDVFVYHGTDYASWLADPVTPSGARVTTFLRRLYPGP